MEPAHVISEHSIFIKFYKTPSNFCIPIEPDCFVGFGALAGTKHYTLNAVLTKEIH